MTPFATTADGAIKKPKIHARSRVGIDSPPSDSTYIVLETYHALGPHRSPINVPDFHDVEMMIQTARLLRGKLAQPRVAGLGRPFGGYQGQLLAGERLSVAI